VKHSIDDLLNIARRYYPRGVGSVDASYEGTEESIRLRAARCQAGAANEAWRAMLRRLAERFPDNSVQNRSIHLPTGKWDACYSGALHLSDHRSIGFLVSFLVPYYIIYSARIVEDPDATDARRRLVDKSPSDPPRDTVDVYVGNTMTVMRRESATPEVMAALESQQERYREVFTGATPFTPDWMAAGDEPCQRQIIRFDFSDDEARYAEWLTRDIESTFGCERLPPEVGRIIVPDVATNDRPIGEATLYDCLFSDSRP
jgi:hypothetical protein